MLIFLALLFMALLLIVKFTPDLYFDRFTGAMVDELKRLSKISLTNKKAQVAENLLSAVAQIQTGRHNLKEAQSALAENSYKFFSALILSLLCLARDFGAPIKKTVTDLRGAIVKDIRFEKKISGQVRDGYLNFVMVAAITWIFIFCVKFSLEIHGDSLFLLLISILQITGALMFTFLNIRLVKKHFQVFDDLFFTLFHLWALCQVGVSMKEALARARVNHFFSLETRELTFMKDRLLQATTLWQESGASIKGTLEELIEDAWFYVDEQFERYLKQLAFLRFAILALFFLSAYFIYIFVLTRQMLG